MYKLYSVEARTEPCDTPGLYISGRGYFAFYRNPEFSVRNEMICFIKYAEKCNFDSLYRKPGFHVG
jgi:hypothetical protein